MTSTPRRASLFAIRTFSVRFIEQPGDCSPSRKVVSKMLTLFCGMGSPPVGKQMRMLRRDGPIVKAIIFIGRLRELIAAIYGSYMSYRTYYWARTSEIRREYSANWPV